MYKIVIGLATAGFLLIGLSVSRAASASRTVLSSAKTQIEVSKPVPVARKVRVINESPVSVLPPDRIIAQQVTEPVAEQRIESTLEVIAQPVSEKKAEPVQQVFKQATKPKLEAQEPVVDIPPIQPAAPKQQSETPVVKPSQKKPSAYPNMWIQAGVGASYYSLKQSSPGLSSLDFEDMKAPSILTRAGFFMTPRLGLDLSYRTAPGQIKKSETINIQNGNYKRTELSTELLFRNRSFYNKKNSYYGLRAGVRRKQLPFLLPRTLNNLSVLESTLTSLSLGVDYQYYLHGLRIEWQARYQRPLSTGSNQGDLKYKGMSVDATLAAVYPLSENWNIGVYWYAEYQKYKFNYNEPGLVQTFNGTTNSLFNNISIRLGAEF